MAEYYPLLAKAIGSLPNSTFETRRIVYERARKALIGQLRTLHPPVPEEDIERESVALDRAIERLEVEIAAAPPAPDALPPPSEAPQKPPEARRPPPPAVPDGGALGPTGKAPFQPLRTKLPTPRAQKPKDAVAAQPPLVPGEPVPVPPPPPDEPTALPGSEDAAPPIAPTPRMRPESQRPIAPQPPGTRGPKRQMWIIWVGLSVVVALVAVAAIKLRDRPETIASKKPAEQTQADSGKISERVGGKPAEKPEAEAPKETKPKDAPAPAESSPSQQKTAEPAPPTPPAPANPEVPVAYRAALLVEAPNEPNKVKTYLGTVVWKLNNASGGPNENLGLGVEADIELPDDKLKATVTFEKNTDPSLPASHTIKVRFSVDPGSATGDVKQISVLQMRKEDSPTGAALAGVTVPVIQNSFLVGLSPGNAESANLELMRGLQWIDIPMLLGNGKIAKLTFEKGAAGERDLNEAATAWQK